MNAEEKLEHIHQLLEQNQEVLDAGNRKIESLQAMQALIVKITAQYEISEHTASRLLDTETFEAMQNHNNEMERHIEALQLTILKNRAGLFTYETEKNALLIKKLEIEIEEASK